MALTNEQYDAIMHKIESRRLKNEKAFERRLKAAYEADPRLKAIDNKTSEILQNAIEDLHTSSLQEHKDELQELSRAKKKILAEAGFKGGIAEPSYTCPLCRDTGWVGNKKCKCFKLEEIRYIYADSTLASLMRHEDFKSASLSVYSDTQKDPATGITPRKAAIYAYKYANDFINDFPNGENICLLGKVGVGKTFFSLFVAMKIIKKGFRVIYLTAPNLFSILEENKFRWTQDVQERTQLIFDCDLLIIDDLGTEHQNSFTTTALYQCINDRLNTKKSTIITTNLSFAGLRQAYSERISSRLYTYEHLYLLGEDIREKLKSAQNHG